MVHDWVVVSRENKKLGPQNVYGRGATKIEYADDFGRWVKNNVTHWWDSSMLYGSDAETARWVRTLEGGKMRVGQNALERETRGPRKGRLVTGFAENMWN